MTWGKLQLMTRRFYEKYCDEAVAYVSIEMLRNETTPEGLKLQQLLDDLQKLR